MNKEENKAEFLRLLRSTEREGVEDLIEELEKLGFFEAPASAGHHLNVDGGLVEHSLNVCKCALMLREQMEQFSPGIKEECPENSVILASLLHDVCKADIYRKSIKKRKNRMGGWDDIEGYDVTVKNFPMGHGEKSVVVLLCSGLMMTDAEMLAIRWHMGPWELPMQSYDARKQIDAARLIYPLCVLIQTADGLSASIIETTAEERDEL